MGEDKKILISIAIPCYRSENNIGHVVKDIQDAFAKQDKYDYQIVLANDGSPDRTFETIRQLCKEDKKIIGIDLSRNYSQANARMALLHYVDGDITVFMDDDGQHPTYGIFLLADKILEGYDDVCAKLVNKKVTAFKRITSDIYNRIMIMMGIYPKDVAMSPFFALNRFAVDAAKKYHSPSPSIHSYILRVSTRFANVEVEQNKRLSGKSGYNLKKLIALAIMNMTNFSVVPLRISVFAGMSISIFGLFYGIFLVIKKLIRPQVLIGYTSLMATMLFLIGIVLIILGLLGEYVGRIYMMLSDLPQFTVREVVNKEKVTYKE